MKSLKMLSTSVIQSEIKLIGLIGNKVVREAKGIDLQLKEVLSDLVIRGYMPKLQFEGTTITQTYIDDLLYPNEWFHEKLRDAALLVLEIQGFLVSRGYTLIDAHPYNIRFEGRKPLWLDIGSIQPYSLEKENAFIKEWIHCYHLLLTGESKNLTDSIACSFLLGGVQTSKYVGTCFQSRKIKAILENIIFYSGKRDSVISINKIIKQVFTNKSKLNSLKKDLEKISFTNKTLWGDYHSNRNKFLNPDGSVILSQRLKFVDNLVKSGHYSSILELAANQGVLSKVIAENNKNTRVIALDYDYGALNNSWKLFDTLPRNLTLGRLDFMADLLEASSCYRSHRIKSECVIVLAVLHHLVLTQCYTFEAVIKRLKSFCKKDLLIEFMPLGLWDGVNDYSCPDWYSESAFIAAFEIDFNILERVELEENRILFLLRLK